MGISLLLDLPCDATRMVQQGATERQRGVCLQKVEILIVQSCAAVGHCDGIATGTNTVVRKRGDGASLLKSTILIARSSCKKKDQFCNTTVNDAPHRLADSALPGALMVIEPPLWPQR